MEIKDNKSLISFVFDQMEKLDKNEITIDQAKAQATLAKQANNGLRLEHDIKNLEMKTIEFSLKYGNPVEVLKLNKD